MENNPTTTPGSLATCEICDTHLKWTGEAWVDDEGQNFTYDAHSRGHDHTPRPGTERAACTKPLAIGDTVRGIVNTGRERTCGYPAMVGTDRCGEHTLPADHPLVTILTDMRTSYARGGEL